MEILFKATVIRVGAKLMAPVAGSLFEETMSHNKYQFF